jgi:hypothetical protein
LNAFRRWEIEIEHVNQTVNGVAHGLAKAVIREVGERIWIEETLSIIFDVVTLEFLQK